MSFIKDEPIQSKLKISIYLHCSDSVSRIVTTNVSTNQYAFAVFIIFKPGKCNTNILAKNTKVYTSNRIQFALNMSRKVDNKKLLFHPSHLILFLIIISLLNLVFLTRLKKSEMVNWILSAGVKFWRIL